MKLKNIRNGVLVILAMLTFSFTNRGISHSASHKLYDEIDATTEKPQYAVFEKALEGFTQLAESGKLGNNHLLTLIDFSRSANEKRLWIIDLQQKKILYHTLVAHGRDTGQEFAKSFSNAPHSHKSSLGFYITGNTYYGKHGLSLRLEGVEKGFNDNARERAIVMHGADYVSKDFIQKYGRLGRSYGCPALPTKKAKAIISLLAHETCVFMYYPSEEYLNHSKLLQDNAS